MEKEEIRYHPLIDGDTSGNEKIPMFLTNSLNIVSRNHPMFLSEMIPDHYRLRANKPMTQMETDKLSIHCPKCGAVLTQIAPNIDAKKLGLYICNRCKR